MSASDFSGRLLAPVIAAAAAVVEQGVDRLLQHALRCGMMMSGAFSSIRRFRRLLRLMTRR